MKRSRQVTASVAAALVSSGLFTACGSDKKVDEPYRCVNDRDIIVEHDECDRGIVGTHYYYGGFGDYGPGGRVYGGNRADVKRAPVKASSSKNSGSKSNVQRGGLGSPDSAKGSGS